MSCAMNIGSVTAKSKCSTLKPAAPPAIDLNVQVVQQLNLTHVDEVPPQPRASGPHSLDSLGAHT